MTTRISCPQCKARYLFDPNRINKAVVRMKCPGCGHAFQVNLAEIEQQTLGKSASEKAPAPPSPGTTPRKKLLIIDDSPFFREMILDLLKSIDAEFFTAADGVEGLRLILRERPDLVLLDLNLPEKNGYELIREVREDANLSAIRLLAMSGVFRKEEEIGEAYRGGADGFIGKSFKPEQLLERVKRFLED
ncbi:MAG: response regulator [Desulfuromonadaceae bacterium]